MEFHSIADLERFCSWIQAPLLFIHFFVQELILLVCRHSLMIPGSRECGSYLRMNPKTPYHLESPFLSP